MISAPVTGPEEPPAGGGRLAVPSKSIVCSLTVAGTKQTVFLNCIYTWGTKITCYYVRSFTSSHELPNSGRHLDTAVSGIPRQMRKPLSRAYWMLFNNPSTNLFGLLMLYNRCFVLQIHKGFAKFHFLLLTEAWHLREFQL